MTYESARDKMLNIHKEDFEALWKKRENRGITVEPIIKEGHHADVIVEEAEHLKADLIVIGTRGRSKLTALIIGSTAQHVVQKAKTSVLAVKSGKHQLSLLTALGQI